MKITNRILKTFAAGVGLAVAPGAYAEFDTLSVWGDAVGDGGAAFDLTGSTLKITGGGADFWGNADQGVAVHDSTGAYTTTGDFSASIQFNNVDFDIAQDWGRSGLSARATTGGVPADGDAHTMAVMRSNGLAVTGWRDTANGGTGRSGNGFGTGPVAPGLSNPVKMSVNRFGDQIITAFSTDIDNDGVYTPWLVDQNRTQAALAGGTEVTVTAFHQAHNQNPSAPTSPIVNMDGTNGGTRVNTGEMQDFAYATTFDPTQYYTVNVGINAAQTGATGQVVGSAQLRDLNGTASLTEPTNWTVTVAPVANFTLTPGPSGRSGNEMNAGDLVPASSFQYDSGGGVLAPGLKADLYVAQANGGNLAANQAIIDGNAPSGTAIIPNVSWTGGSDNDANYNGLTGPASFAAAVQGVDPADGTAGAFSGNEENYGVDMSGQIYIEPNGGHQSAYELARGGEWVQFKDGIDDFTYLEIDGQVVLNDNNWTGVGSTENGGGDFGVFDASDPKFDDGEWVSFKMIMWEGGGGDAGMLYSDMFDDDGTFDGMDANGTYPGGEVTTGVGEFDDEAIVNIDENGEYWIQISANVDGRSTATTSQTVSVIPEPSAFALLGLAALGLLRRRR